MGRLINSYTALSTLEANDPIKQKVQKQKKKRSQKSN